MDYDFLIVGSGLYGAVFAHEAKAAGKRCLVIEKRNVIGGNIRCQQVQGINCHLYGPHIFHTNDHSIWQYVNRFAQFNNFVYSPMANYNGKFFNLPFNMNTFNQMWGVTAPAEAMARIAAQRYTGPIGNLEQQAQSLVGVEVYEKLVKGYTEKQWGRDCKDLPAFIIKRLPVRFTYDNNYFNDRYQGIPIGGYNQIIERLLRGIEVWTGNDYFEQRRYFDSIAEQVVYTGPIDKFFDHRFGRLEYRSLRFEHNLLHVENFQGCAVVNHTSSDTVYTRVIEHKHFERVNSPVTAITYEFPLPYAPGAEPFYPVNDANNNALYTKYKKLAEGMPVIFGGRLGSYQYYNMDQVIAAALVASAKAIKKIPAKAGI